MHKREKDIIKAFADLNITVTSAAWCSGILLLTFNKPSDLFLAKYELRKRGFGLGNQYRSFFHNDIVLPVYDTEK